MTGENRGRAEGSGCDMSAGEEDRIERYVALEKTYVHDVYDHMSALQYAEQRNTAPWPKVKKFLNELEPGSIVCDVGKYRDYAKLHLLDYDYAHLPNVYFIF